LATNPNPPGDPVRSREPGDHRVEHDDAEPRAEQMARPIIGGTPMFSTSSKPAAMAALSVIVLGLAACGESSEEKAKKQACAATSEISKQIQKLETLPISSSFGTEVKTSGEAIDKSVGEIKKAAPNLATANKEEFEAATKKFQLELASLIATTVSSSTSGEAALKSAEPKIKASLSTLATDYKKAFEALKC
jgi:hypothetical protein